MALNKSKHSRGTRLFHMSIALLIVTQLITSQLLGGKGENVYFEIHEYSGLGAFVLMFLFWIFAIWRREGTAPSLLFPWFSGERLMALWQDMQTHFAAFAKFKLPPHDPHAALPSATHGLGVLLVLIMGLTGTVIYVAIQTGNGKTSWAGTANGLHETFSNLVWAYLIGHVGIALINHFASKQSLSDMWSMKKDDR